MEDKITTTVPFQIYGIQKQYIGLQQQQPRSSSIVDLDGSPLMDGSEDVACASHSQLTPPPPAASFATADIVKYVVASGEMTNTATTTAAAAAEAAETTVTPGVATTNIFEIVATNTLLPLSTPPETQPEVQQQQQQQQQQVDILDKFLIQAGGQQTEDSCPQHEYNTGASALPHFNMMNETEEEEMGGGGTIIHAINNDDDDGGGVVNQPSKFICEYILYFICSNCDTFLFFRISCGDANR